MKCKLFPKSQDVRRIDRFDKVQDITVRHLQVQASVLRRSPEIVVATPGRLIDHLHNTQSVGLEELAVLVLDEADRWELVSKWISLSCLPVAKCCLYTN